MGIYPLEFPAAATIERPRGAKALIFSKVHFAAPTVDHMAGHAFTMSVGAVNTHPSSTGISTAALGVCQSSTLFTVMGSTVLVMMPTFKAVSGLSPLIHRARP